jgi:hypothetical protein
MIEFTQLVGRLEIVSHSVAEEGGCSAMETIETATKGQSEARESSVNGRV